MTTPAQSLENYLEQLIREDGPFPVDTAVIRGVSYRVFKNAPPSLLDYYRATCGLHGERCFLVFEDERWTFAETFAEAARLAHALKAKYGVAKGDRVVIAMRNYPEWVFSFIALTGLGAIAVPVNAWWTEEELSYGLEDSGAKLVIADGERIERLQRPARKHGARLIGVRMGNMLPAGVDDYAKTVAGVVASAFPEAAITPEDDATIFYTSGSTGFPKGVVSSHRAIVSVLMNWAVYTQARLMELGMADATAASLPATLMTVPLFHVTGSHSLFLLSMLSGRKVVLMYKWDPQAALRLIERERITSFAGVPTMSWELLQQPNLDAFDLSSLADIGSGGAARPAQHVKMLKDRFPNANPGSGYGLTETNAAGAVNNGDSYLARPGSTGKPTPPLVEMKIVGESEETLPAGERGEIYIKSACNFRGYWNKPQDTEAALTRDGWFRTGDLGYLDADGFLFIVDRAKDIVIRGGENISCFEVEQALYQHPDVFEVSVFGLPDERLGETLNAAIVLKPGRSVDAEALKAHVRAHLAPFKVPERIWFRKEQLPRTASGKIYKRQIRAETMESLGVSG